MILDQFKLDGKVAIVTGSSTGLGQGMSIALAQAGAKVLGVDICGSEGTQEIIGGEQFSFMEANLISTEPVEAIISEAVKRYGKLDILVNNAGIIRREDFTAFREQDWDDVLTINLRTLFFLSQAAVHQFLEQGTGGKIVNVASMLSFQGGIRVPSYTASKSGVKGITMAMANELAKHNININAIAPGYMATNNTTALRADEQRSADILARIPAGRWGTPEDIAGACVFLASAASDYVNGYTLAVDGGWLAR